MPTIKFTAANCNWSNFARPMGVPIRTTVGQSPRWFKHDHEISVLLAPHGIFRNDSLTVPQMIVAYTQRLDDNADELIESLNDISARHGGERLVFLCFDDVHKPGSYCHRTWAGAWFHERHGLVVPELTVSKVKPPSNQGALFG
jgi:hypothetical protein